ncbi:hypothetical protein [Salisediminibacterium selenitireducens]|uniref:Uncharacterized protein n=1 Tax=Bacillus selenitireducens (strain ATCC 700615 / DSM 15326 / MLS10) TaxID=439292 RepID=D6Y036_BACIE|nr:hypothetical protein [Salisediminibacterium selenitireducens]ADI00538.1 hypothetical protein Bsel_3056 [[Bacillus] selenitireducens MLS10]
MIKKVSIAGFLVAAVVMIVFGQSYWNDQVERTAAEALEYSQNGDSRASSYLHVRDGFMDLDVGDSERGNAADGDADSDENGNNSGSVSGGSSSGDDGNDADGAGSSDGSSSSGTSGDSGSSGSSGSSGTASSSGGSSSSSLSAQEIVDTYFRQFERLQRQEVDRVNRVLREAESDFAKARSGNHSKSEDELRTKYLNEMQRMESQADARFKEISSELKTALDEHGHDTSKASEFEAVYEAEKESRRLDAVQAIFR